MSCFKIIFILTKILLILSLTNARAKDPDKVIVATINNHVITAQDVLNATKRLPQNIREKSLSEIYPNIVNELVNQHLITNLAYKDKIDQKKNVKEILKKNKDQIIARYWLDNFLYNQTTEDKIQNLYNIYLKNFRTYKEYNASHILVKSESEALHIIKEIKVKSDFSKFAKNYSIGPSKKNGGNLGWFKKGQMVKEFEQATFKLKKGMISAKPVKTQFGYHIILLNDVREANPKKLQEIKKDIIREIRQNSLTNLQKQIRKDQNIKIFDFQKVVQEINN